MELDAASDHAVKVLCVERAIDLVCSSMASNRMYHQSKDEDVLTVHIVDKLHDHGFSASHDADTSGHPDIKVWDRTGFEWLCEAKVHSSYAWIFKGFKQLTTRYSCGGVGKTNGEVLIYCYTKKPAQDVLAAWLKRLSNPKFSVTCEPIQPGYFRSSHTHKVSGLTYNVRHKVIGLYYDPEA
ncbi:hypothetical protein [Maritimibacter alkaliphilus]|uniref:hypothetical protein n=1 Tax=Maritimibacter alkaliphilus TaxID=404236 RepID=UPI001C986C66|nr:hypothetical protein [Maritimibacter alkaliphilus]MBY6088963.1 hypothetical protein [Maritimibacter alkaliphilus]